MGVGRSTTRAVVTASIVVIVTDFFSRQSPAIPARDADELASLIHLCRSHLHRQNSTPLPGEVSRNAAGLDLR